MTPGTLTSDSVFHGLSKLRVVVAHLLLALVSITLVSIKVRLTFQRPLEMENNSMIECLFIMQGSGFTPVCGPEKKN